MKFIADYCNISIFQVQEINFTEYRYLLREAYIYKLSQTEQGQNYLEKCWTLEQTKPDIKNLKRLFGKGEK